MSKQQQKKTGKRSGNDLETLRARDAAKKAKALAAKKAKQRRVLTRAAIGLGGAALIALIWCVSAALIRNSGILLRRKVVAETEHYQVTAAMFACYFRQCANSYLSAAEANSELSVYDPEISLKEQEYSNGETWYDLFADNTMSSVQSNLQLCEAAYAAGYTLDEQQLARCKTIAEQDDLSRYQKGVRLEDLEEATKLTLLAQEYQTEVRSQITVTDDEISAYYQEHRSEYLTASVLGYSFPWSAEGMLAGDSSEMEAAMEAANGLAACETQQEYTEYVYRYLTDTKGMARTDAEQTAANLTITTFVRDLPQDVQSWLLNGAKRGDTQIFSKTEQLYASVYMLREEPAQDDSKAVDFRVIYLTAAELDGIENAVSLAEELRTQVTENGGTSEAFAACAQQHSEDASTYANGGLVSGYSSTRTTYGDETAAWAFDRERQQGDMTLIQRSGAVLLLYFEGANPSTGWENQIKEDLYSSKVSEFRARCAEHEVTVYEKNYKDLKA